MHTTMRAGLAAVAAAFFFVGCSCGGPTVSKVVITPASPSVERGKTVSLTATATFSDSSTKDVTAEATWSVTDGAIASVSNTDTRGVVTGTTVGTTTVKAIFVANGSQGEGTTDVTVTAPPKGSIVVTPRTGLTTTEAGGTATFTVALSTRPTEAVTISLSSSDTAEGTVSPAALVFTSANFNAPQTVTVTGVDDTVQDGAKTYTIVLAPAVSGDVVFSGVDGGTVTVSNTDNDTAGVTVTPTTGLTTTEGGGSATFTVVLNSRPAASVTIGLSSSKPAEGTPAPTSLTFTTANWNAPQTVTVTGVDDQAQDGPQSYLIVTAAATSTDTAYAGVNPSDVAVTNTDNDTAGVTVNPTTGLNTSEGGGSATFTVVLNTKPTADVTIGLLSSATLEGTVSPASLTFTTANWNAPQTVTVTGVDDQVEDGNQPYTVTTAAAVSTDTTYNGVNAADVNLTNLDDDSAGIVVAPTSGLVTTEAGGTATFTVVLSSRPTANVTIAVSSSLATEGTVSPTSLTFTAANYNAPQTVTVTGVNDAVQDGNQPYTVVLAAAVSTDTNYNGINPTDVSVTNNDNDTAAIVVTAASNLTTTEDPNASGHSATFTVALATQPTASVTIALTSSNTAEGTVSPASITFTTANWNSAQTITVTGVDDSVADGNQVYSVVTAAAVSTDTRYSGMNAADVSLTNTDNDTAGVTVSPTAGLTTTEDPNASGHTATFTVRLNSQPTATVTIPLSSSNTLEGTVSPASLVFTTSNWSSLQTVTVTGQDDSVADGNQVYSVVTGAATSTDTRYSGVNASDVSLTNTDNDSPGFTVSPLSGLTTTEDSLATGHTATFTVRLTSQPTASVTVALSSSNTLEGTVSPASLTFTTSNWNSVQTVTVTGVDDSVQDGLQAYSILTGAASSSDTGYNGLDPADVSVSNIDDDSAGFTVTSSATPLVTTESGGQATFTVRLNSAPTASVSVALSSSNTAEGAVSPASLTFTTANWNSAQTVTVTGVNDLVADGNQPYTIVLAAATSTDATYNNVNPPDVTAVNNDNDTPNITVTPVSGLVTSESGTAATFTVVLDTQPTANVTITLSSSDTTEGAVAPTVLVFTPSDYNSAGAHTVTVTGVDDAVIDGAQQFTVVTGAATSSDTSYNNRNADDVSVTNNDNDSAGFVVTLPLGQSLPLTTDETGAQATYSLSLTTQPSADVTVNLTVSDTGEATVSPSSVTFTSLNWNAVHTVTVTGADDLIADSAQAYNVVTGAATSTDPNYGGLVGPNVPGVNMDDDTAGINVSPQAGLTTNENLGQALFTIVLRSQPTADVTIPLHSSDTSEGSVFPASVTFTTLNWNAPQVVTVTGVDDAIQDGPQAYQVITDPATGSDTSGYVGLKGPNVSLTNADNDTPGITVTPTGGLRTTEDASLPNHTAQFSIVLNSPPTANVTIALTSSRTGEGTVTTPASGTLTFTSSNWSAPQFVTVTGVQDAVADGNQPYQIVTAAAASADLGYDGINPADVSVINQDDDSAGIIVTQPGDSRTSENVALPYHTATFSIRLTSQPAGGTVTINLYTSRPDEGTLSTSQLVFDSTNWSSPQTVTVTGVQDLVADGNQPYNINTAAAVAPGDSNYNGMDGDDVPLTNIDDDSTGIIIIPDGSGSSGRDLTTSETNPGQAASFIVKLNSQPTADVTIAVRSSDTTEATVTPATLTFTTSDWAGDHVVTVTGQPDQEQDGDQLYTVLLDPASSTDPGYNNQFASTVTAINLDKDSAGVTVVPSAVPMITTEAGGTATFTVKLDTKPSAGATVTIALSSSDTTEGTVAPAQVVFNDANWNSAQTVTVTGVNDFVADGQQNYNVVVANAASADPNYNGQFGATLTARNLDNDTAGIVVAPTSGLTTTEDPNAAGHSATFTVVLLSEPTANVTIAVSSSDTSEGTVAPATLTFTDQNWSSPQVVTVTGVDDAVQDSNIAYVVQLAPASSSDGNYDTMDPDDVQVTNTDNDVAGITVTPTATPLITTEAGGTATFSVVLNSQPTADVTISVASSNTTEGTVSTALLTFTTANWSSAAAHTVTVSGVNDFVQDGDIDYTVLLGNAASTDPNYSGKVPGDVDARNLDNDIAGYIVVAADPLETTESGGSDTFTVRLRSQPTADVTLSLSVSDTTEGAITNPAGGSLTFTSANWNTPQTVTVTGQNDDVMDGNQPYTVSFGAATSTDPLYAGTSPSSLAASNTDNDIAGVAVSLAAGHTSESGGTTTFTVRLNTQPTADVVIALSSSDTTEGTVAPVSLTFTPANWNLLQTVVMTGVDDFVADGAQGYNIVTAPCVSGDANYSGLDPDDVAVVNHDNDSPGFVITPTSGLTTTEAGGTSLFTVKLLSQPTASVTLPISSSNTAEGTVSVASLSFTTANWNVAQVVVVTGVDDGSLRDGNQPYLVVTGNPSSADPHYNGPGHNPVDVSVTNLDNDTPAVAITPTSGLVTSEGGGSTTFTVVLLAAPTDTVTFNFSSSNFNEGAPLPANVTFTTANWATPQTITVLGIDDSVVDGDVGYTILTSPVVSTDLGYNGLNPADVACTNLDND